jgi:hypothetical protein
MLIKIKKLIAAQFVEERNLLNMGITKVYRDINVKSAGRLFQKPQIVYGVIQRKI